MGYRKDKLTTDQIYHVYNKSIEGFKIFYNDHLRKQMLDTFFFYNQQYPKVKFSTYQQLKNYTDPDSKKYIEKKLVEIISYCIMPTHFHLIVKQLEKNGISELIRRSCNSYSKYFNTRHKRKGPLWSGRFQNILVTSDSQFLHLSRYIDLNPTSDNLVKHPSEWAYSSYNEHTSRSTTKNLAAINKYINLSKKEYKNFVNDRIDYQRTLKTIRHMTFE